jgi:hypothetical protein
MSTLGYSDDERLSRREIAKVQLIKAIDLFVTEQFIPSITLAGAAEEILGKLLQHRGEAPILDESFAAIQDIRRTKIGLNVMDGKPKKEIVAGWNKARNNLKHHGETDEEFVVINACDEAYWMIRRALANSKKLGVAIPNANDFENWIVININM